jgi:uncharacterized protein YbjT (DUF2867 family)
MNNPTTNTGEMPRANILVLGATGGTGRLIISQALARGHQVAALVRSPEQADNLKGAQIIVGDAMDGRVAVVRVLLEYDASVRALDGMFSATPLVWAAEGWSHSSGPGADHVAVARLLIAAGSSLEWVPPANAPSPERTQESLLELRRAAERSTA